MMLPADTHVHSEWSWDTGGPSSDAAGRMQKMCERAVHIGLPAIIFTEHLDFAAWRVCLEDVMPHLHSLVDGAGYLNPPRMDVSGYLNCIDRCRHRFPELRILTGVEFGQPHLFAEQAAQLLDLSALDRVNGSLHTLQVGEDRSEPDTLFRQCAVAFGSDAHVPGPLAANFPEAVAMLEHFGFQPGTRPESFWTR